MASSLRLFVLMAGDHQGVSLQDNMILSEKRKSFCLSSLLGDKHKSKKPCKAFQDISKYFSEEEWAKLSYSEKTTYVYMKRNYTTMTGLGLKAYLPDFMQPKKQDMESEDNSSFEGHGCENQDESPKRTIGMPQIKPLKKLLKKPTWEEKKVPCVHDSGLVEGQMPPSGEKTAFERHNENASEPEKKRVNAWTHKFRKRKQLVSYEEISDPDEGISDSDED